MYFVFSKLNPVRNVARNAPPVPTIPVMKPEIPPPVIVVLVFAANFSEVCYITYFCKRRRSKTCPNYLEGES